jgi:hypothetical protein
MHKIEISSKKAGKYLVRPTLWSSIYGLLNGRKYFKTACSLPLKYSTSPSSFWQTNRILPEACLSKRFEKITKLGGRDGKKKPTIVGKTDQRPLGRRGWQVLK